MAPTAYCIDPSYEQDKSFERTFLLGSAVILGCVISGVRPTLHPIIAVIAITIAAVESGIFSDVWSAIVILGLSLCVSVTVVFVSTYGTLSWTPIMGAMILTVGARSMRAHSWFCRTFRGEPQVASMLVPLVVGYTMTTVWMRTRGVFSFALNAFGTVTTLAFMSPWHDDNNKHGFWITASFVSAQLICITQTPIDESYKWLPILSALLVCIVIGEIHVEFQQWYLHIVIFAVTMCEILYCVDKNSHTYNRQGVSPYTDTLRDPSTDTRRDLSAENSPHVKVSFRVISNTASGDMGDV